MSSGFVSGGTADAPIERSDEWLSAQQELEENRRRKAEQARQTGGRSLFETLEANKAAKQEAFEEANKLKNQFRALDEDEIDFLDSVLESTRAEEERVRRETAEGLELFRRQQEEADKKLLVRRESDAPGAQEGSPVEGEEQWIAGGRKRKRTKEKEVLKGVKLRRSSTNEQGSPVSESAKPLKNAPAVSVTAQRSASTSKDHISKAAAISTSSSNSEAKPSSVETTARVIAPGPAKGGLGLVDYGSDEDDD